MNHLISYLKNPLVKVSEICRETGINPGFMSGVLKGDRKLPEKYLWPILNLLASQGLQLNGWLFSINPVTNGVLAQRQTEDPGLLFMAQGAQENLQPIFFKSEAYVLKNPEALAEFVTNIFNT